MHNDHLNKNETKNRFIDIEQRLQGYTDVPVGIAVFEVKDDFIKTVFRNRWYYTFFGYDNMLEAEFKDNFFGWYSESDRPKVRKLIIEAYRGNEGMAWVRVRLKNKTVGALIKAFPFTVDGQQTAMTILTAMDDEHSALTADMRAGRHYQTIAKNANHISFDYNVNRDEMFYVYHHENLEPVERLYDNYLGRQSKIDFVHPSSERTFRWALSGRNSDFETEVLIKNPLDDLYYWNRAYFRNVDVDGEIHVVGHLELRDVRVTNEYRIDKVSGVIDRGTFEQGMEMMMDDREADLEDMVLVLFNIEGLDAVDEAYGMEKSNAVIRTIGRVISSRIRGEDLVGRYSGSSFILMLRHIQKEGDAAKVVRRMKKHIDAAIGDMALDVPIGVMTVIEPVKDGEDWYRNIAEAYEKLNDEA